MRLPTHWFRDLLIIVASAGVVILLGSVVPPLLSPERLTKTLVDLRSVGPLFIIPIIVLEVVIAPIPGGAIPIVLGGIYGPWLGTLYSWIGNVFGSLLAFWLAKRFGRPIVERLTRRAHLERFDRFFNRHRHLTWVFYALPIFPVDLISFALGLSRFPSTHFVALVTLAFIPHHLLLNFLGDRIVHASSTLRWVLLGSAVVFVSIVTAAGRAIERKDERKAHLTDRDRSG